MMKKSLGGLVFAGVLLTAAQASAQSASSSEVAQCAQRTHAPGSYEIANQTVVAGVGGTQRGARNVADCIADLRGIQYAAGTVSTAPVNVGSGPQDRCARLQNRTNGQAAALAIGAGILGGFVGVGIHGAVVTSNYQNCLESGAFSGTANGTVPVSYCTRRGNPLVGGTGYCRR